MRLVPRTLLQLRLTAGFILLICTTFTSLALFGNYWTTYKLFGEKFHVSLYPWGGCGGCHYFKDAPEYQAVTFVFLIIAFSVQLLYFTWLFISLVFKRIRETWDDLLIRVDQLLFTYMNGMMLGPIITYGSSYKTGFKNIPFVSVSLGWSYFMLIPAFIAGFSALIVITLLSTKITIHNRLNPPPPPPREVYIVRDPPIHRD